MEFRAKEIFADYDENDVLIIGFLGDSTEQGEPTYFIIQDSEEYDEQDRQLGMDTYYIEKNDQSMGGYGGISEVYLRRNKIKIEFNSVGIGHVKEKFIEIEFECNEMIFNNLQQKINQVFSNRELKTF